jgi:hypothetical protein
MALYFDYKIQNPISEIIHVNVAIHSQHPLIAVASYGEEKGGFVTLYNDEVNIIINLCICSPSQKLSVVCTCAFEIEKLDTFCDGEHTHVPY